MCRFISFLYCLLYCSVFFGQSKPNILFIVSEDNGVEMGCYGTPIKTPHLDKLAQNGVLFENAYVTQAGCSQSRASFLTGLYPHQNGQIGLATWKYHMFDPNTPNIPKSLKIADYNTGIIGKLHVNPESAFPFDFKAMGDSNFARKNMGQYAVEAKKFISQSEKPFFLQINYPDAHAPFIKQVDGIPKNPLTEADVDALPYMMVNNKKLKELTANYYNCMMRLDTYVGELIQVLKDSDKYQNTLIIYIGDHGADMLRGKRTCYEGGVKIPMIMAWPGIIGPGTRSNELVSTIDIYPTLLDVAGMRIPKYLPGKSLLPLLNHSSKEWRSYLFTEYHLHSNHNPYPQRAIRNERFKLIHNLLPNIENPGYGFTLKKTVKITEEELLKDVDPEVKNAYHLMKIPPEYELYDLKKDPFEKKDLSKNKAYEDYLAQLKEVLFDWQHRTADALIDKSRAEKLFELIQNTGIDRKKGIKVSYGKLMDPHLTFDE